MTIAKQMRILSLHKEESININIQETLLISCIMLINITLQRVSMIGALLALCELFAVVIVAATRKYAAAYTLLIVLITSSLEVASFVFGLGDYRLYSMFKTPFLGTYAFNAVVIALAILTHQRYRKTIERNIVSFPTLRKFRRLITIMLTSGALISFIAFIFNDNGTFEIDWYFRTLLDSNYSYLGMISFIYLGVTLVISEPYYIKKLKSVFIEILMAGSVISLVSVALGMHGYYGNATSILLMPLAVSLCPVLIPISSFVENKNKGLCLLLGISFTILSLFYGSLMGSKYYIVPVLAIFVYVLNSFTNKRVIAGAIILCIFLLVAVNFNTIMRTLFGNEYLNWKVTQLINSLNIFGRSAWTWYSTLSDSPRYRVDEFVNILLEYVNKPWYLPLGKGTAGTITQRWGLTTWGVFTGGNFDKRQVFSQVYLDMHESINVLFLRHGLLGLYFLAFCLKNILNKFRYSFVAIPAMVWLLFYWNIYYSWWIGLVALIICMHETDRVDDSLLLEN